MRARSALGPPLLLLALLISAPDGAEAQLSPGELAAPHSSLEGASHCLDCHEAGHGVSPKLCLDCHVYLAKRIAAGQGLHSDSDYSQCERCHVDHHGTEYELIWWGAEGRDAFDHQSAGYELVGAHRDIACEKCHRESSVKDLVPLRSQGKDLMSTYLGLDGADCLSCHEDEHRGQFPGSDCIQCHSEECWKPALAFDHASTLYPLTGLHVKTPCRGCHVLTPNPPIEQVSMKETLIFKGLDFDACSDCHSDPHQSRRPARCEGCHSTAGWRQPEGSDFDHDATRFTLTGRHLTAGCAACHEKGQTGSGGVSMPFRVVDYARCTDCHRDPHEGRLGAQCEECHSTAGWSRTAPESFDHDRTRYPLKGRHVSLRCSVCHPEGSEFRVARFGACADCHEDVHRGQFLLGKSGGACEPCHVVEGFIPSLYSIEDHAQSSFALELAHLAVACTDCHRRVPLQELSSLETIPIRLGDPPATNSMAVDSAMRFRFQSTRCHDCHADLHRGEARQLSESKGCEPCHTLHGWRRLDYNHSETKFPLEGAHLRAPCSGCHPTETKGRVEVRVQLTQISTECLACHRDPHRGQLAEDGETTRCQRCHSLETWRETSFVHDRDSVFALEGAHKDVACSKCHPQEIFEGEPVVRFKPIETTCVSCHVIREPYR